MGTKNYLVGAGVDSEIIYNLPKDSTVTLKPGSGGSMSAYATTSSEDDVKAGNADWELWPAGAVTKITSDSIDSSITAIKASAVGVSGILRVRV
ncbi:MAG: hypothetical protein ACAH12_03560 [Methylophilaceae bacterium]